MATTINSNTTDGIVITPDTSGEIELQADGVTKAKVTANGLQDANGASLRGGSFRNLIINGDMSIAQRGTSVTGITTSGYKAVDRYYSIVGVAGTWTQSQDTDVPTGQGFSNSIKWQCTTANTSLSSGAYAGILHRLEGQHLQHLKKGTSNAASLTLSFWVKSNKTGTYTFNIQDTDNSRMVIHNYNVNSADTWEKKTITINGDTTGVLDNDNQRSLQLEWWFVAGTNYASGTSSSNWITFNDANRAAGLTVNLADSTSNYINITGVQLEVGEGASDFEVLPYDVQLARCQRYYYHLTDDTSSQHVGTGYWGTTTSARGAVHFPVQMRTLPSVSYSSGSHFKALLAGVSFQTSTAIGIYKNSETSSLLAMTTTGGTTGQGTHLEFYSSPVTTTYLGFSAEL